MLPFGQTVYFWRIHRGLTQEALARKAGLPRPNLSAVETGRREVTLGTIRTLARALGVTPGGLVDGSVPDTGLEGKLSRRSLERIAGHLAGKPVRVRLSSRELRIAEIIRPLIGNLKAAHGLSKARQERSGARYRKLQWLKAVHLIGPGALASLTKRIEQTRWLPPPNSG